jgi:hypothetical protein
MYVCIKSCEIAEMAHIVMNVINKIVMHGHSHVIYTYMCICMYVCMHGRSHVIYTYMCICMYVCMHGRRHVICVRICVFCLPRKAIFLRASSRNHCPWGVHAWAWACNMCVYVYSTCKGKQICVCACVCVYLYNINIHMHMHMHTRSTTHNRSVAKRFRHAQSKSSCRALTTRTGVSQWASTGQVQAARHHNLHQLQVQELGNWGLDGVKQRWVELLYLCMYTCVYGYKCLQELTNSGLEEEKQRWVELGSLNVFMYVHMHAWIHTYRNSEIEG